MLAPVTTHHLAQVNIGRLLAPIDSPLIADFVAALEAVNARADAAPGFVWRLQTDQGDATSLRPFEDDLMIINMSVWESLESLRAYVYRSEHARVMAGRRNWFERHEPSDAFTALWWVPVGTIPSIEAAKERLADLAADGPSPRAFTFRTAFPPPH